MINDGYPTILTPLFSSSDSQPVTAQSDSLLSHFQVRPAESIDLSSMAQILADSFHSPDGFWGWAQPLLRLGIYEDLRQRLRTSPPHHLAVALPTAMSHKGDTKVAGTIEMALRSNDVWQRGRSRHLYLSNLAVCPTHRRQGVAQQLLLNCEQVAISWGFQDLYLHVLENNHPARQLYFKMGYRLHQVDSGWNVWLIGRPRQLFLHKHLSDLG